MRTLGVYLLAGGISFNALATDISEVVVNYDGTQPIHKYLKHTDRNASISAIPHMLEKRFDCTRNIDRIKLEMALLANSKQIKNAELNDILKQSQINVCDFCQSGVKFKDYHYDSNEGEIYTFDTQVSDDNVISCTLSKPSGERAINITEFGASSFDRKAIIESDGSTFDNETAYFTEQAILKEAIKISRNNIDFMNDVNLPNTIISVDFMPGVTDYQKKNIYNIMMHYTVPGAFNKVNIANFKYMLTQQLLKDEAIDTSVFYNFLLHPHFIELTQKNEEIRDLHFEIYQNKLFEKDYLNSCEKMVNLLADKYLAIYNNHIISAYLHALGGVKNVTFVPKTLYQLIAIEAFMRNDIYIGHNVDISQTFFKPTFDVATSWLKSYDVNNYDTYINLLSLANENAIRYYTKYRSMNSMLYKVIKNIKKDGYIAEWLDYSTDAFKKAFSKVGYRQLFYSCSNAYTSVSFYNAISQFINAEYKAQSGSWRVYHGYEYVPLFHEPDFEVPKEYSSSFSDGLFSGSIHDSSDGCAARATFYRGVCYYSDINIEDHMNNRSNFYIPSVHTIIPMFGKGELHHVRTKVYQKPEEMNNSLLYSRYWHIPGVSANRDDVSKRCVDVNKLNSLFTEDPNEIDNIITRMITRVNTKVWDHVIKNKPRELD